MSERLIRSFRFRLKPTRAQHERLRGALEHCRQLYNAALEERLDCYRKTGKGRSFYDQCMALTVLRQDHESSNYAATMQRGALRQVDIAYKRFFDRGGFPRFKGKDRYKCLSWPQGDGWVFDGCFHAKGLGSIKVHQHRAIPSKPLSAKIKREGRHWYLSMQCVVAAEVANDNGQAVGVDLGISTFAALSDGTLIANPRHARTAHKKLHRRQRELARCKRGSKRRAKARERLSRVYLGITRSRRTHHFQVASVLVRQFGMIAVENLNVKGLSRGVLARDVNEAGWGQFIQILCDKAEGAGRRVVKVDPRYTSQTCPECGQVAKKLLSQRVHSCDCGFEANRDVAAARVILHRAVHGPTELNVAGCGKRALRKAVA